MSVDFVSLRRKMVDNQVRTVDVTDLGILAALSQVPREEFVPFERRNFAYLDSDIMLNDADDGSQVRTLMRPAALARLLQLAQISKKDKVLDVGATSGYASAIVAKLADSVASLECDEKLSGQAAEILGRLSEGKIEVVCAPLEAGYAQLAPYDVILCEGAADFVPEILFEQLQEHGRLIVVEGYGPAGVAKLYIKEHGVLSVQSAFNLALAPLVGFQRELGFVF